MIHPPLGTQGLPKPMIGSNVFFFWDGMKHDVHNFVEEFDIFQCKNGETVKSLGTLQTLMIAFSIWRDISMDCIAGLPKSRNKLIIMVVVDHLSKYAHLCALQHPFIESIVAQCFMDQVFNLHGMPHSIIFYRDSTFTNNFWQELFKLQGTQLQLSTSYHPQTDDQTEVVNKCLETYLRCLASDMKYQWAQWLPLVEWFYNTSYHTTTRMTPFEVVYGKNPPSFLSYFPGVSKV
jgi:hypothetical protein